MASYHLSCKTIGRSAGRSATGAAAYRAAERIHDERTGETHDYTRKRGVVHRELVLPQDAPAWARDREQLWNAAEAAERRKNSTVAREFEIALPSELNAQERRALAVRFARELVERHGVAVDVSIHKPHREGDHRNHHAHVLCSTRRLTREGFTQKTRELDDQRSGEVVHWRGRWAELQNETLKERGLEERVDHRSLEAQGIDRLPAQHFGPAVNGMERRGIHTDVMRRLEEERRQEIQARIERAAEAGRLEREAQQVARSILDLSGDLAAARRDRDAQRAVQPAPAMPSAPEHTLADRFNKKVEQSASALLTALRNERGQDRAGESQPHRERAESKGKTLEHAWKKELEPGPDPEALERARNKDRGYER